MGHNNLIITDNEGSWLVKRARHFSEFRKCEIRHFPNVCANCKPL